MKTTADTQFSDVQQKKKRGRPRKQPPPKTINAPARVLRSHTRSQPTKPAEEELEAVANEVGSTSGSMGGAEDTSAPSTTFPPEPQGADIKQRTDPNSDSSLSVISDVGARMRELHFLPKEATADSPPMASGVPGTLLALFSNQREYMETARVTVSLAPSEVIVANHPTLEKSKSPPLQKRSPPSKGKSTPKASKPVSKARAPSTGDDRPPEPGTSKPMGSSPELPPTSPQPPMSSPPPAIPAASSSKKPKPWAKYVNVCNVMVPMAQVLSWTYTIDPSTVEVTRIGDNLIKVSTMGFLLHLEKAKAFAERRQGVAQTVS
jgi:hypothetical protein